MNSIASLGLVSTVGRGVGAIVVVLALGLTSAMGVTEAAAVRVEQSRDAAQDRMSESETDESPLTADQNKCERSGGLWVNGFCEIEG